MYIDTHLDTLWNMIKNDRPFFPQTDKGHVDLIRARNAGLAIGFFTGFPTESRYITQKMVRDWLSFTANPSHKLQRIDSKTQFNEFLQNYDLIDMSQKHVGAILHFEGAAGIDSELNLLYIYHEIGLRSMSLTWNEENQFATGAQGDKNRGITQEGRDLLDAMSDLGIIVDVSHLNDKSFWEVHSHYNGPLLASHSNVRSMADHPRNLTEEMVYAIADTGGSIGVNFHKAFLKTDPENDPPSQQTIVEMFGKLLSMVGSEHVHFGSDFDGCQLPDDVPDIEAIPGIISSIASDCELNSNDIENICYQNISRVVNSVWK